MFKNTFNYSSANPFSSDNSFATSIYNKTLTKPQQKFNHNQEKNNKSNHRIESDSKNKQHTNIFDIKQQNPFQKYTNLQDLVRQGLTERHQYQREKRRQLYSNKNNHQSKKYPEINSHRDYSHNNYKSNQPYNSFSDSYITSNYTLKKYQQNIPQSSRSYFESTKNIPSSYFSSYTPLVPEQTQKYETILKQKQYFNSTNPYLKSIITSPTHEQNSSSFNFNDQSRESSIQKYFPKAQNPIKFQIYQQNKTFQQQQSLKQSKQQKYNYYKNTSIKQRQQTVLSSQRTFPSKQQQNNYIPIQYLNKNIVKKQNEQSESLMIPFDLKQSLSFSVNQKNPFKQFNENTQNINFQNSNETKQSWPESLTLNNIVFYKKQLKYKCRTKNN